MFINNESDEWDTSTATKRKHKRITIYAKWKSDKEMSKTTPYIIIKSRGGSIKRGINVVT